MIISSQEAASNLSYWLQQTNNSHQPITIQGQDHNAVLLSEDDWRAIHETLYLLSIPNMRESIITGMQADIDDCDTELEW